MRRVALMTAAGFAVALAACDPVSPEVRARHTANEAARVQCYHAAGFTTGQTAPPPADGSMGRTPGRLLRTFSDADLRAPDGTWLRVLRSDTPEQAQRAAETYAEWSTSGYTGARAVGRRLYIYPTPEPYVNDALDRCLAMP